ncbi:hypothetical protein FRC03_005521 [Tulasnella sp. 419]|nr:hypothetical protein FRC03_005521 [Tulasnella sp. 419]
MHLTFLQHDRYTVPDPTTTSTSTSTRIPQTSIFTPMVSHPLPKDIRASKKSPTGAIIGAVVGSIAALGVIIMLIWFLIQRKRHRRPNPINPGEMKYIKSPTTTTGTGAPGPVVPIERERIGTPQMAYQTEPFRWEPPGRSPEPSSAGIRTPSPQSTSHVGTNPVVAPLSRGRPAPPLVIDTRQRHARGSSAASREATSQFRWDDHNS